MISFTFGDNLSAEKVAQELAAWSVILATGYSEVNKRLKDNADARAAEEKQAAGEHDNVIQLAKTAKGKLAVKPKPKADEKLTEARVRSIMIDYVNIASKQMKAERKEVFLGLLGEFSVGTIKDLPTEKYQAMVDLVEKRTRELSAMANGE